MFIYQFGCARVRGSEARRVRRAAAAAAVVVVHGLVRLGEGELLPEGAPAED